MDGGFKTTPADIEGETSLTMAEATKARKQRALSIISRVLDGEIESLDAATLAYIIPDYARAQLAHVILRSWPSDIAEEVCQASFKAAGMPVPSFGQNPTEDARQWAFAANDRELMAYACVSFGEMPAGKKKAFLDWCRKKQASANG